MLFPRSKISNYFEHILIYTSMLYNSMRISRHQSNQLGYVTEKLMIGLRSNNLKITFPPYRSLQNSLWAQNQNYSCKSETYLHRISILIYENEIVQDTNANIYPICCASRVSVHFQNSHPRTQRLLSMIIKSCMNLTSKFWSKSAEIRINDNKNHVCALLLNSDPRAPKFLSIINDRVCA